MKVMLHEFMTGAIRRVCICSLPNGKGYTNKTYVFEPETEYNVQDETLQKYLKGELGDVRENRVKTDALIEKLKYYGVPYTIDKCSTCPSAQPHVHFNPFKIVEE